MPNAFPQPAALIPSLDGLPAPWGLMALLLYITFVLHLVLMNALVGVAVITVLSRLRLIPEFRPEPPSLSGHGGHTPDLLLPKGVAFVVNLGIPPFLFMQCIYGQFIYTSSVQMALWWLSVMLVVMLAYYGFYINMYRKGMSQAARTTALTIATLLLLWNAFLFVNNITLLQHPEQWGAYAHNASGTLLNLGDPQLLPRYLHIILACLAVGGLALAIPAAWSLRRLAKEGGEPEEALPLLDNKRKALRWFFFSTLAQIPVGGWFLISLPAEQQQLFLGGSALATSLFAVGLVVAVLTLVSAWSENVWFTLAGAMTTIFMMTGMRTILRSSMLEPYYSPQMRPFDFGPLLLFVLSLVLSAAGLFWLAKVYMRHKTHENDPSPHESSDPELLNTVVHMRKQEALLVIELGLGGKDEDDTADAEENRGGDTK